MRNRRGFTLVEVIVVLVIIGILIAVAVPSLLAYIDKTNATACGVNRHTARDELLSDYMEKIKTAKADGSFELSDEQKDCCPADGTISAKVEDGFLHVYCSIHSDVFSFADGGKTMATVMEIMKHTGNSVLDSNAIAKGGTGTAKTIEELEKQGIFLSELNAVSWRYEKNNGFFFWTDVDISKKDAGSKLPVMRHNSETGTYTVWISTINKTKKDANQTDDYLYMALNTGANPTQYKPSTEDKVQSYETALELFKKAQAEYNT